MAFLNSGLVITLRDERIDKKHDYVYKGGILEFVKYLNQNKDVLHTKPVFFSRDRETTSRSRWRSSTTTATPNRCSRS